MSVAVDRINTKDERFRRVQALFKAKRGDKARELLRELVRESWPGDTPSLAIACRPIGSVRASPRRIRRLARIYGSAEQLAEVLCLEMRVVERLWREATSCGGAT